MLRHFQEKVTRFTLKKRRIELPLAELEIGLNQGDDWIAFCDKDDIRIYDRICDHAGGKLVSRSGVVRCPLHGWVFDPKGGTYVNVNCSKKPLFKGKLSKLSEVIKFELPIIYHRRLENFTTAGKVKIRYLNHACLLVETPHFRFAVDPWIIGPAFARGWWLAAPSPADSFEALNACDFIYISHNHPDHLHPQTLSEIRKDMPMLTPNFITRSTQNYLAELGFNDVSTLDFNRHYVLAEKEFAIGALKSGDFRDDSGIVFQSGTFSAVLSVDSNYIDFYRFPKNLTLLCSSFAGGATGFPLIFETHSEEEKKFIVTRNKNVVLTMNKQMLSASRPDYFLPYAGMFKEIAPRDGYIRNRNVKNSIEAYQEMCKSLDCELLNVGKFNCYEFHGETLAAKDNITEKMPPDKPEAHYLEAAKQKYLKLPEQTIAEYFEASGFNGELLLIVTPTDDDFNGSVHRNVFVDFSARNPPRVRFGEIGEVGGDLPTLVAEKNKNVLHVKVRREALFETISEKLPWEDISIGFQCRINRSPNVYNSDFWYHFTNVFINKNAVRMIAECSACEKINQSLPST